MPAPTDRGADDADDADVDPADYDHRTVLTFPYADERRARTVHDAVAVERGEIDDDRSTAEADRVGDAVEVTVRARDLVALRAGTNTWLRLVGVAEAVADDAAPPDSPAGGGADAADSADD
ncbi:KEOPS complex subunit Pcc1 [Halobaculum sp. D14]|uniref:KEOPS complex subunit Pcc1 n=1 Tax=unclassified Halobaculum TaxID=2640896 RepID=UPI003EB7D312